MTIDGTCHLCRVNADVRKRDTTKILQMWEELDDAAVADDEGDDDADDQDE